MEHLSILRRHADLLDNMARTLGVDIEESVMTGQMEFDGIADAVLRCTGCSHPDCCTALLAQGEALSDALIIVRTAT